MRISRKELKAVNAADQKTLAKVSKENWILKEMIDKMMPDFKVFERTISGDSTEVLGLLLADDMKFSKQFKQTISNLDADNLILLNQVEVLEEDRDGLEENLVTLRATIRNKIIDKELEITAKKLEVDAKGYKETSDMYKGLYEQNQLEYGVIVEQHMGNLKDLNVIVRQSDELDKEMYKGVIKDLKDVSLEIAKNNKVQVVVPELTVSQE